nr:MAG TPA: hypothetical protein [Caudoviricetes sp.]
MRAISCRKLPKQGTSSNMVGSGVYLSFNQLETILC